MSTLTAYIGTPENTESWGCGGSCGILGRVFPQLVALSGEAWEPGFVGGSLSWRQALRV